MRPWILLLALASCRAPISWIAPSQAIDSLLTDTLPAFDEDALEERVHARYGDHLERVKWMESGWRVLQEVELQTGDLILVKNRKAQSLATSVGLAEATWFDHSGMIEVTEEGAFVIDSWPAVELLVDVDTFVDRFQGGGRVQTITDFLSDYHHAYVLRPQSGGELAVARAKGLVEAGLEFDPRHNPTNPAMSCVELLEYGLERTLRWVPVSEVEDVSRVRLALGWDVNGFLTPDLFLEQADLVPVGEFGRHRSSVEARALREVWFEIHRYSQRPGSSMGDWIGFDRFFLFGWKPRVKALLEWSVAIVRDDPTVDPVELARFLVAGSLSPRTPE